MVLLLVISCDKNELGEDISASSINVIEKADELDILASFDIDGLITRLEAAASKRNKNNISASKNNGGAGSYIKVSKIKGSDTIFEFVWDNESDVDWCMPADQTFETIFLELNTDEVTTAIKSTIDGDAIITISSFPPSLYGIDLVLGTKFTLAGEVADGTLTGKTWSF